MSALRFDLITKNHQLERQYSMQIVKFVKSKRQARQKKHPAQISRFVRLINQKTAMNKLLLLTLITFLFSCSSKNIANTSETLNADNRPFELVGISNDDTYGYSAENPIQVGGVDRDEGPLNERKYLDMLAGPNGEKISYVRARSCCPIKSDNDPFGFGSVMLDEYHVTWEGTEDAVSIYINMYDYGVMEAPVGFTLRK